MKQILPSALSPGKEPSALWSLRQNFLPSPWQQADVSERLAAPLTTQAKTFLRLCSQALTRKP